MSIQATILAMFADADAKARALYPAYAARPVPKVVFYTKGRNAGLARHGAWQVDFNVTVASQVGNEFADTVSHEIAHMVDYALRGKSGHDRVWRMIHRSLGGNGSHCTKYSVEVTGIRKRVKNEYLYRNANGAECWVGPKFHASMMRGTSSGIRNASGQVFRPTDWTRQRRTLT